MASQSQMLRDDVVVCPVRPKTRQKAAHEAMAKLRREGKISKGPCAICGTTKRTETHHEDYRKPLDIVWLCRSCHHSRHAQMEKLCIDHHGREIVGFAKDFGWPKNDLALFEHYMAMVREHGGNDASA